MRTGKVFAPRTMGCLLLLPCLLGTCVVAGAHEGEVRKAQKEAGSRVGRAGTTRGRGVFEPIESIAESWAYRKSEIYREIRRYGVSDGKVATEYLRRHLRKIPSRSLDRQTRICLEILQCYPDPASLDVLTKLVEVKAYPFNVRRTILYTMCLQKGGVRRVETFLKSPDEKLRAAAIGVLCSVYPEKKIRSLLQEIRAREKLESGSPIERAVADAQRKLGMISCYFYHDPGCFPWDWATFAGRFRYIRKDDPYERSSLFFGLYTLGSDPDLVFVWQQLQCLWYEDPELTRMLLEEEIRTAPDEPGAGEIAKHILEDLAVGTCPRFDPKKVRCSR